MTAGTDDAELFPETAYGPSVPTAEERLGFRLGDRAAFPVEIERCLKVWEAASPRAKLVEYARSHEGASALLHDRGQCREPAPPRGAPPACYGPGCGADAPIVP